MTSVTGNTVWHFVDENGALELANLLPQQTPEVATGSEPVQVAVSPDGQNLYVTNYASFTVSQYGVNSFGGLVSHGSVSLPANTYPRGLAVSYFGTSLYVANSNAGYLSQFAVGSGGALTPLSTPTVAATGAVALAPSTDGQNVFAAEFANNALAQFTIGSGGALSRLSPPAIPAGAEPAGIAVTPLPPGTFLGCQVTGGANICLYQESTGTCQEFDNGQGPTTIPCGPLWVHFKLSHRRATVTVKLHLSTHFRVLVKNHAGKLLERIRLGLLKSGPTRVHFNLGRLAAGTYTLVIQALPPGKKPVLGPNPLTLHLTSQGNGRATFFTPRKTSQSSLLRILSEHRKQKKTRR